MKMNFKYVIFLISMIVYLPYGVSNSQTLEVKDIQVIYRQKIAMRDGVNLSANIFKPAVMDEPLPAIMVLTPYNNDHNTKRGVYYARNGYVFVTVDVRGRGDSEGKLIPFEDEGENGYDAIEWIAAQPWCNGKVATMGGSYKGMDQWLLSKEFPPHLVTMAPTATVCPGIDATRDRNIYRSYNLGILSYVSGRTKNLETFRSDYNNSKIFENYINPDKAYAELLDAHSSPPENKQQMVFKRWISHPTLDSYWLDMLPSVEDFKKYDIPILSITGYYDSDQPGHMYYYDHLQKYGTEKVKSKTYFIIGPWDHGGTRRPSTTTSGLNFGDNAVIDILGLHREWFDWTMKDGPKPAFLEDHVTYFVEGENRWESVASIEDMSNKLLEFYLSSPDNNPSDVFVSGELKSEPASDNDADFLIYDPLDPRYKTPAQYYASMSRMIHQNYISEKGWLYYHSSPFSKETELSGFINLKLFAEIDTRDTDFNYCLYEIKRDGSSVMLGEGLMRARFRNSLKKEEFPEPGKIYEYNISSLNMINRKIGQGSRLRLQLGYLDTPAYQKNYNSGGDVSYETRKEAKTATIKVYSNEKYPSRLELPILTKE